MMFMAMVALPRAGERARGEALTAHVRAHSAHDTCRYGAIVQGETIGLFRHCRWLHPGRTCTSVQDFLVSSTSTGEIALWTGFGHLSTPTSTQSPGASDVEVNQPSQVRRHRAGCPRRRRS